MKTPAKCSGCLGYECCVSKWKPDMISSALNTVGFLKLSVFVRHAVEGLVAFSIVAGTLTEKRYAVLR